MRNYVLVSATCTEHNSVTRAGNGIRKLKRGIALELFVTEYLQTLLAECDELHQFTRFELLERDGTWTAIRHVKGAVFTWTFTEYPEGELITAVSHLTRDELLRDLKELLPLKAMQ